MAQKETLTDRQQAIVAIAANEARGDLAGLASSIEYGLDNGLTVNQVKEILSHLYAYTGFPRSLNLELSRRFWIREPLTESRPRSARRLRRFQRTLTLSRSERKFRHS